MSALAEALQSALHRPETRLYRWIQGAVWALIVVSVVLFVVHLALDEAHPLQPWLEGADWVLLLFFTVEIALRVATVRPAGFDILELNPAGRLGAHLWARLRYSLSPLNLVDILTVATLVPALRGLRAIRLLRLLRGVRIFRYAHPLEGLERAFRDNALLYGAAFSWLGLTTLVGGTTIFLIEREQNANIEHLADGIWWAIVTLTTVGFGDITPETRMGQAVGAVMMVAGMFTLALFAGIVGHTLLRAVLTIREEQFRMSTFVNHVVVCGYDPGARMLLDALLSEIRSDSHPPVVFAPGERPSDIPTEFVWVSGDPTKESELEKARLTHAAAVILVGSRLVAPQHADATTILTTFTIRSFMAKQALRVKRRTPLYLVAEILDAENVAHTRSAGADEVIETTRLGFSLMAHAVSVHGTGAILSQVVSVEANSLYVGECPEGERATFAEVSRHIKQRAGGLLVGVRDPHTGEDILNPPDDLFVAPPLQLIYLAESACLKEATSDEDS